MAYGDFGAVVDDDDNNCHGISGKEIMDSLYFGRYIIRYVIILISVHDTVKNICTWDVIVIVVESVSVSVVEHCVSKDRN
jgi:hypothetical protein